MNSSTISKDYTKALEELKKLDEEPVGFSDFTTSVPSNNIPIRQNNIIIQLLINLAEKIDHIEKQIAEINQHLENTSTPLPSSLLEKQENLTLSTNNHIRRRKINPFDNSKWNFLEEKEKK